MVKHIDHIYKFKTQIYIFVYTFYDKIQKHLVNHSRFILVA